jgi:plastocyanin
MFRLLFLAVTILGLTLSLRTPPAIIAQQATPPGGEVIDASACQVEPRAIEDLARLVGTPAAEGGEATPDVTEVDRRTGEPEEEARNIEAAADEATTEAVTATYRELVACLNAGDYLRIYALYSDDYVRRLLTEGGQDLENLQATPAPEEERTGLVSVSSVQWLDDDHLAARVETFNPTAGGTVTIDAILVPEGDRYLIDDETVVDATTEGEGEATPMADVGAAPAAAGAIVVETYDIYFEPTELTIPADTDVTVTLPNDGVTLHNFSVDELGIDVDIDPGATEEAVINASAGIYEYYCNVPGHKEAGMVGTLTVE